jgi:hypothetical protein
VPVFLSIGRCGTQWLAATFAELYGESAEVEHEPLGGRYWPRRFFRSYANAEAILELPEVAAHVERVARSDYYVETGWPVLAALPMLATAARVEPACCAEADRSQRIQPHYARRWHQLSSYEKCLFWWTDLHMLGLEFPTRRPEIPLVRVQ